jgi:hypothetical protein
MIPALGIPCASKGTVFSASPVPSMASTIMGWFRPMELVRRITTLVDRESQVVEVPLRCSGVIQPLTGRSLEIKPEGQRSWNWEMLHTTPDVALTPGEDFTLSGVKYRVMSDKNYSGYGYVYYEVVRDFTKANG